MAQSSWFSECNLLQLESDQLEKVVLARDHLSKLNYPVEIDARQVIATRLEIEYPSTWLFLVDGLVGATPRVISSLK